MNQNSGNSIATNQANVGAGGNKDGTSNANAEQTTKPSQANSNSATPPNDIKLEPINASNVGNQTKDCVQCGVPCNRTNASPHGALCNSCYHHWRYTSHKFYQISKENPSKSTCSRRFSFVIFLLLLSIA